MAVPLALPLDHTGLETSRIEADVAGYAALGARLIRWGLHAPTGGRIAMLRAPGGTKIELIEVHDGDGTWAHTAFLVTDPDDLAGTHDRLVAAGLVEVRPPFAIPAARAESSFLRTPGGSSIQLIAYHPGSPDLP
ncbi:VOC family protein [Blastococcus sp. TF02A-26]|uniref:VOC family protein n=1 Tax=Blastococcus sp. TF02A-26 TaxID=2250577 RepID=UPI000DEB739C|nr:VOC family protein [Blastococcus sp. TF02A-26]RBY86817.1 hypothetical protein DQ240_08410 [Blastococcus sp. TF02A-26]